MLNDMTAMNPKGHVKLELYNEDGVFYTKEKKNLVVQSANKIVAEMMADPAKVIRISQVDEGDTALSSRPDGLSVFPLTIQHEKEVVFQNNWGAINTTTSFILEELKGVTELKQVKVGETELVINEDVFLLDAAEGNIEFKVAPTEEVTIQFLKTNNPYMKIIAGTEKVTVDGESFTRSAVASDEDKTYQVNHRTGEILFASAKEKVKVSYDYHMNYSLGFMALGGKPNASHPNYQPVEFGQTNRLDIDMKNEYAGSRMPIHYPSEITEGATEIDPAIPTQPVRTVLKTVNDLEVTDIGDGVTKKLVYELPNLHDNGSGNVGRVLHEVIAVTNITKSASISVENVTVETNTMGRVEIGLRDEDIEVGDTLQVEYRLKLDDLHLIYQLGQSPVVELVSVVHHPADGRSPLAYNVVDRGLNPNQGDVWISNPNTGHISFSKNPTGGYPVETPGQLTVEYKVNSGTKVKFIADFPKGVPAPTIEEDIKTETISSGQTSVILNHAVAKDESGNFLINEIKVNANGNETILSPGQYEVSVDGRTITFNTINANDQVTVNYQYEKATHDIYQVAMFDRKDGGRMFNISGIGPITKDKDTGMRVTWSVTF